MMTAGQQRELASRLQAFVVAACTNAEFRSALRFCPEAALATHRLRWENPGQLALSRPVSSVRFDSATLFGVVASSNGWRGISEENTETKLCLARCKPLLLNHAPEAEAARLVRRYHALGLAAVLSGYEFCPEVDDRKSGYSNSMSGVRPAQPGSGAWRTVVAGFEMERVMLAWLCLLFGWHEFLGSLLGYPGCCARAFPQRWEQGLTDGSADPAKRILDERSRGGFAGIFRWETNIFARYFSHEMIQHFPCRFDCRPSIELAHRSFASWSAFEPEGAALARKYLGFPILFTRDHGVALFPDAKLQRGAAEAQLDFDAELAVVADSAADLKAALQQCGGKLLTSESVVQAGEKRFEGWLMGFE